MNGKLDKTFETIRCELGFRHKLQQSIVTSLRDKSWWKILYLFSFKSNETHCSVDIIYEENNEGNILPMVLFPLCFY